MSKPMLFISHINEEQELAIELKNLLEKAFVGLIDVFVSSDPRSNEVGGDWWREIQHALKNCIAEITLASPKSVKRPWINFEAGAVWVRDCPVCPLCHSGMTKDLLPEPLKRLTGLHANSDDDLKKLIARIAKKVGGTAPDVDFTPFLTVLARFEQDSSQYAEMTAYSLHAAENDISQHEVTALLILASQPWKSGSVVLDSLLKDLHQTGIHKVIANLCIRWLERKSLIELEEVNEGWGNYYHLVRLTTSAWQWIEDHASELAKLEPVAPIKKSEYDVQASANDDVPF